MGSSDSSRGRGSSPGRTSSPDNLERRKHQREPIGLPLEFQIGDGPRISATTGNISLGGMFVTTDTLEPHGTDISIYIHVFGDQEPLVIPSVVRWSKPKGMGVQYVSLTQRQIMVLMEVIVTADTAGVKLG